MAMNCILIETDQGRYCDTHQTWHEEPPVVARALTVLDVFRITMKLPDTRPHICIVGNSND